MSAEAYLAKLRQYAAVIKAQGEALRQGRWAAARQQQELAAGLAEEISALSLSSADEGGRAEAERELQGLLAEVEAQLAALTLLKEEVAAELGEICRWRQRLQAFRLACRPTAGQNVDVRG